MINFEQLLLKYMQHICNHEGTTYAHKPWQLSERFTMEEKEYLVNKSKEIHYDY